MKPLWIASLCLALVAFVAQAGSSKSFELKGSVEFSPATDKYLLVYSSNEISSGPNVYGRVLKSDGTPTGRDFRLSTQTGEMSKPVVSYSPLTGQFLAVWSRKLYGESRSEIIGRTIEPSGRISSDEFRLSFSDMFDQRPSIAYCPGRQRFLVTWTRGPDYDFEKGVADVYGQFVDSTGTQLQGSNFVIAAADKNQFKSDVTCDVVNDRFLVLWEDQRQLSTQDDIYGQLISSDGTLMGANFLVAGTSNIERRPVAAANSVDGSYLLVWESGVDGQEVMYSQKMDSDGHLLQSPILVGPNVGGSRNRAAMAYLKPQNVYFVVFANSGADGVSGGIYGQFLESNGQLRETAFPVSTAKQGQYRPGIAAAKNTFLVVWTDYRDTANTGSTHNVYEYYGRVIGNDMALSSRWRNPESQ